MFSKTYIRANKFIIPIRTRHIDLSRRDVRADLEKS